MQPSPRTPSFILPLLGALSVITPFAIDLCLPAFPQMAKDLSATTAVVSLCLSTYFIGLAFGQIFYGPLLDRFGRKPPLYFGLILFILASIGCYLSKDIHTLLLLRFIQAIGGCAAQVASIAMVRDFYPSHESAKIFSLLFLFIGVSPLLAPTVGSLITVYAGWRMVFLLLAIIAAIILGFIFRFLPEAHTPDKSISLKAGPIIAEFFHIAMNARFITYALAGAFSFAGLFAYVAGSPIIFMEQYHMSARAFGAVFATLAVGFIGSNQVNVMLLKRYSSELLFSRALFVQTITGALLLLGAALDWWGLTATLIWLFIFLGCAGILYPNAAALALEPFTRNTGSAAALLGVLQLGVGAIISSGISVTVTHNSLPILAILAITPVIGLVIFLAGRKKARVVIAD